MSVRRVTRPSDFASAWGLYHLNTCYCAYARSVVQVLGGAGAYSVAEKAAIKKATREIDAHLRRKRKGKK